MILYRNIHNKKDNIYRPNNEYTKKFGSEKRRILVVISI